MLTTIKEVKCGGPSGGNNAYRIGIVIGQIVGAVFCLSGLAIIILGFNGNIEWFVKNGSFESKITHAGPGVIFAMFGAMILWRYKPQHVEQTIETDRRRLMSHVDEMKALMRFDREHAEGLHLLFEEKKPASELPDPVPHKPPDAKNKED